MPALIGVKVADGDDAWYAEMRAHCQGLAVFVPGHHLATGVANGAAAGVLQRGVPEPGGRAALDRPDAHGFAGRPGVGTAHPPLHGRRDRAFIARDGYANPALDKLLAAIGGWADDGQCGCAGPIAGSTRPWQTGSADCATDATRTIFVTDQVRRNEA